MIAKESTIHPGWFHIQNFEGLETFLINKKGELLDTVTKRVWLGNYVGHYYRIRTPNTGTQVYVHRLMASTFIRKLLPKEVVNHIDGNKLNNNIENLEITSASLNTKHAYDMGLNKGHPGEPIFVIDLKKPEPLTVKKYEKIQYFIDDIGEDFLVSRSGIFNSLKEEHGVYKQRFYFSRHPITEKDVYRCLQNIIIRKEIFTDNVRLFSSIPRASSESNVTYEQLDKILTNGTQYLKGYLFKRYGNTEPWLKFEEAFTLFNDDSHEVIVYDIQTGLKYLYTCKTHVKKALKVHGRVVERALLGENRLISERYLVKYFRDKNTIIF